ncbi:MAG: hypothetical protein EOM05_10320, partial [Clostridia bacterium]|nr:hypothetical protein [Clostridia bacterium]
MLSPPNELFAIVLFVKVPEHIWVYCLIMGGSTLAGQIIMWPYVLRKVSFTKPTISGVIKHFKPNLILFLPSIAISLYQVMDKIEKQVKRHLSKIRSHRPENLKNENMLMSDEKEEAINLIKAY